MSDLVEILIGDGKPKGIALRAVVLCGAISCGFALAGMYYEIKYQSKFDLLAKPPGQSVIQVKEEFEQLKGQYGKLESDYTKIKDSYVKLKAEYDNLNGAYLTLQEKSEKNDYNQVKDSYEKLKAEYDNLGTAYSTLKTSSEKQISDLRAALAQSQKNPQVISAQTQRPDGLRDDLAEVNNQWWFDGKAITVLNGRYSLVSDGFSLLGVCKLTIISSDDDPPSKSDYTLRAGEPAKLNFGNRTVTVTLIKAAPFCTYKFNL